MLLPLRATSAMPAIATTSATQPAASHQTSLIPKGSLPPLPPVPLPRLPPSRPPALAAAWA